MVWEMFWIILWYHGVFSIQVNTGGIYGCGKMPRVERYNYLYAFPNNKKAKKRRRKKIFLNMFQRMNYKGSSIVTRLVESQSS
jgi:hypothetical protein